MNKSDLTLLILDLIFIGVFIYLAVESRNLTKNEREDLLFLRRGAIVNKAPKEYRLMTEKEIDESNFSLEKTITKIGVSLMIGSILSALLLLINVIFIVVKIE